MLSLSKLVALVVALSAPGIIADNIPELPPVPVDLSTPVQARLAFDGATGMTIGWNTFQQIANPQVHYGLSPNSLQSTALSSSSVKYQTSRTWANTVKLSGLLPSTTYYYKIDSTNSTVSSFTTARAPGDDTPFTAALVIDLGVFGPDGLSTRNTSSTNKTITYPLKPGEHTTIQRLMAMSDVFDFVVHPGDFGYADKWHKELKLGYIPGSMNESTSLYEGLIEQFYDQLSVVSSVKPYMVGAGNHEANCLDGGHGNLTEATFCPPGQTNFTGFINRFGLTMPGSSSSSLVAERFGLFGLNDDVNVEINGKNTNPAHCQMQRPFVDSHLAAGEASCATRTTSANVTTAAALPPFWYSFDYGMVHFIMITTETDLGNGLIGPDERGGGQGDIDGPFGSYPNQQVDFIDQDLASVNRSVTPWVVVAGHRPWYVANEFPCTNCQTAFENLFIKHNVDIGLFGHCHNQQLIAPIKNNQTDPNGWNNPSSPAYVVNGAAGHFEGLNPLYNVSWLPLAYGDDTDYGFSQLVFKDRQHVEIQFINSGSGNITFSQTLFKDHIF
ncbi:Metallo-dependent phosphatase [Clavulina sp. PMI_390]|nr:Metallo-dependent phosphatase [Clavulina sp. PMI_390]